MLISCWDQYVKRLLTDIIVILVTKLKNVGRLGGSSIEHPTSAQVMISWLTSSSPASGSVLTAQSLEPASDSVSPSLCPSPIHALSLAVSKIK